MIDQSRVESNRLSGLRIAVTGAGGQLGQYLGSLARARGAHVVGLGHQAGAGVEIVADVADRDAVFRALERSKASVVLHTAAYTDVDGCERNPGLAESVNADGSRHVAEAARSIGAHLVAVSTDFVFPGDGGAPYGESAPVRPISTYGTTKLAGEQAIQSVSRDFAIARTAWLYGGEGKHFPRTVLTMLRDRGTMEVVDDEIGSPTCAKDLAAALIDLAVCRAPGVFHLVNSGSASRYEFACAVARAAGLDPDRIGPTSTSDFLARYPLPARRPPNSALANVRAAAIGISLRPWQLPVAGYTPILAAEIGIAPVETSLRSEGASSP